MITKNSDVHKDVLYKANVSYRAKKLQILTSYTIQAREITLWRQEAECQRKFNLRGFDLGTTNPAKGWHGV